MHIHTHAHTHTHKHTHTLMYHLLRRKGRTPKPVTFSVSSIVHTTMLMIEITRNTVNSAEPISGVEFA